GTPRSRDPGNLPPLWQAGCSYDCERDQLPGTQRRARDRKGAELFTEHSRSFFASVCQRRFPAHARARIADRAGRLAKKSSADARIHQAISHDLWIAAASWAALRRDDYLPE